MNNKPKREENEPKTRIGYIPHGINSEVFYRIEDEKGLEKIEKMKENMFGGADVEFAVIFNNRNIKRKSPNDVILAFKHFNEMLTPEEAEKTRLIMHTNPHDENGPALLDVVRELAPEVKVIFSSSKVNQSQLNVMYNCVDVCINLASNEGFGLSTAEAIMAERMIVANVTGGLQDQMGFVDNNTGEYLDEDIHYNSDFGSNHKKTYIDHGDWVIPVWPVGFHMEGSQATPYILDDRPDPMDAARALHRIYNMDPEKRAEAGRRGREFMIDQGMDSNEMGRRMISGIEDIIDNFEPRRRFDIYKVG